MYQPGSVLLAQIYYEPNDSYSFFTKTMEVPKIDTYPTSRHLISIVQKILCINLLEDVRIIDLSK